DAPAAAAGLAAGLEGAPPTVRAAIYEALGAKGDDRFLPLLVQGAREGDEAAIVALGAPGYEGAKELLAELVGQGSEVAFDALVKIGGREGLHSLLLHAYGLATTDAQRVAVLRAIARTPPVTETAPPVLVKATMDPVVGVAAQHAALAWAESTNGADAHRVILDVLEAASDRGVRVRALTAWGASGREDGIQLVASAMNQATDQNIRTTAIVVLRDHAGDRATGLLARACAGEEDPRVLALLIEAIGDRGDAAGASVVEPWLEEGPPAVRAAATSAYLALAAGATPERAQDMYVRLLGTVGTGAALEGLERVGNADAIGAVTGLLAAESEEHRRAALTAVVRIADRLATAGRVDLARDAYRKALEAGAPVENRLRLLGERIDITARGGRVHAWWIVGPFSAADAEAWENAEWPEEEVDLAAERAVGDRTLAWRPVQVGGADAVVDLDGMFSPNDRVVAYAYAEIVVRRERDAVLKLGSDDGVRVWVNGELVHTLFAPRGLTVDEDIVAIHLNEGVNTLLVKICELGGGWAFCCRIEDDKERPLKFKIR
ncbi:MAG: HEAT repeat domain-containing protein, partial [Planctomycetota bacterium]